MVAVIPSLLCEEPVCGAAGYEPNRCRKIFIGLHMIPENADRYRVSYDDLARAAETAAR